ncbi:hypothetical protein GCM10023205_11660 [Yinghuangia aomiensis]|uniref:Proteins of 100 residues with WXG n=1 Tax=Yinghuangia aomiensis TaxID=676205 RepID=A0ABP9GW10_9ACTN
MSASAAPDPPSGPSPASVAHASALARTLARAADRLDADAVTLAAAVRARAPRWRGPAADAFATYAHTTDALRSTATTELRTAAGRLEAHARGLREVRARGVP